MKQTKNNKYFKIILIGFILLLLDVSVKTGISYPHSYQYSYKVIGEFQFYTINTIYGATCTTYTQQTKADDGSTGTAKLVNEVFFDGVRVDILNDLVGFALLAFGMFGLKKINRAFYMGGILSIVSIGMSAVIHILPFMVNGLRLCYIALFLRIALLGLTISVYYMFMCALVHEIQLVSFKTERKALILLWFAMTILQIVILFITWIQLPTLTMVYNIVLLGVSIFFFYWAWKVKDYVLKEKVLGEEMQEEIHEAY